MRLLHAETFQLVEFPEGNVPPYAILSHTWDRDELLFDHFRQLPTSLPDAGKGIEKVRAACKQTLADKLEYLWVDTCCINKGSSAELSEAINSMFRWYQQSVICYAFLADVSTISDIRQHMKPSQLSQSRWFTRGWTLQEILAPRTVVFYSSTWEVLGSKDSLSGPISEITLIDTAYLRGQPLSSASIAQRMSWAARRTTTRAEDIAYCLLGIFDINMPLLYGEGSSAFYRLQEEILRLSNDESLFAWWRSGPGKKLPTTDLLFRTDDRCGLFAESPADFASSGDIIPWPKEGYVLEMNNSIIGLELISVPKDWSVLPDYHGTFVALQCRDRMHMSHAVCIPVAAVAEEAAFCRASCSKPTYIPVTRKRMPQTPWPFPGLQRQPVDPKLPVLKRQLVSTGIRDSMPRFDVSVQYLILPKSGFSLVDAISNGADWDPYWKAFSRRDNSKGFSSRLIFQDASGFSFLVYFICKTTPTTGKHWVGDPNSITLDRIVIGKPDDVHRLDKELLHCVSTPVPKNSWARWRRDLPHDSSRFGKLRVNVNIEKGLIANVEQGIVPGGESAYVVNVSLRLWSFSFDRRPLFWVLGMMAMVILLRALGPTNQYKDNTNYYIYQAGTMLD